MYNVNFYDFYAKVYVYKHALPKQFMTLLVKKYGYLPLSNAKTMGQCMYEKIPENLTILYKNICVSYIAEYLMCTVPSYMQVIEIFPGSKEEFWNALGVYFDLSFDEISTDLQTIHNLDVMLFNQIAYRISTFQLNAKTRLHFLRALEYAFKLTKIDRKQRTYLNDGTVTTRFLQYFQKVYERIMYGKIPIDDLGSNDSILNAFIFQIPFKHSKLNGDCPHNRCFDMRGNKSTLHILAQSGKPLNLGNIQGALEIVSYGSPHIICDRRLNHDLVPSKHELLRKYSSPVLLHKEFIHPMLMQNQICDLKPTIAQERIFYCLEECFSQRYVTSDDSLDSNDNSRCLKKIPLNMKTFTNYELNMQLASTFVHDFLLWILSRKI